MSKQGTQTVDGVNLTGIQSFYWSGTELGSFGSLFAEAFGFSSGSQGGTGKFTNLSGWAVRSGDVSMAPVPLPGALLLMAGSLGLLGFCRRARGI